MNPNRVMAFGMCTPASIKGLLLNKNVKGVSPYMSHSEKKVTVVEKNRQSKKQNKTRNPTSFEFRMTHIKGKQTTRYSYKIKFPLRTRVKIELVRKLLLASIRKYNKTV